MWSSLPARRAGAQLARRFPPPAQAWSPEYAEAHRGLVAAALDDAAVLRGFAAGRTPGAGYGAGFDERVVEYPWAFARLGAGGRVLDAGSVFNHPHILDRALPRAGTLTITTLAPEPESYPERGIAYVYADLRELPFPDGGFDVVACLSTLEHVGMDTAVYGADVPRAADPQAEAERAVGELRRVTRPDGGRLLLSVPYGRREDHGWMRQLDAAQLEGLIAALRPAAVTVDVFALGPVGWTRSTLRRAAAARYHDALTDRRPAPDGAAAARAVACVAATLRPA